MSYMRTPPYTTSIDDLPELSDLERQGPHPMQSATKDLGRGDIDVGKYIRGSGSMMPSESGMMPHLPSQMTQEGFSQPHIIEPLNDEPRITRMPSNSPDCITIHDHVVSCPICKVFYNNDKTVYIIAISVLAIICILLLKKVMDV
jgi:hypothetical protein